MELSNESYSTPLKPNPDPPEAEIKLPQRHQGTKSASGGLIFTFASLCLGGVNVSHKMSNNYN